MTVNLEYFFAERTFFGKIYFRFSLICLELCFSKLRWFADFPHREDLTEPTRISYKFQNVPKTLTGPIPETFLSRYRNSVGKKLQLPQQISTCSK